MRTRDEIEKQIDAARSGESNYFGQTYEEGVAEALLWALGDSDDPPIEDEHP